MYHLEELNQLEEAVNLSPANIFIRLLLIKKLQSFDQYVDKLKEHITVLLKQDSQHKEAKQILLKVYFKQGKYSVAIVLGEELLEQGNLELAGQILLARSLLKEGNLDAARKLYQSTIASDPDHSNEELDMAFRQRHTISHSDEQDNCQFMQKPSINFSHVGGMSDVKKEIELKIIKPLEHADLYKQYGKKIGGGILLYGPPGCGKTYMAKATAGEINANFINIGLNDILDMWMGNSEKNLSGMFDLARRNAPCVLFIDEIDALGAKRSDLRQSAGKNVINQFLSELDGIESGNEGVLIIGATNCPWHLDSAFRRPGRFDRIIFVPPPDVVSKEEILKIMLAEKPISEIDYTKIAKNTKEYSGADLNALIDIAIEEKLLKALESGITEPLGTKDLIAASKKHKPTTIDWFQTAKNYALFANKSGLYDSILNYINKKK